MVRFTSLLLAVALSFAAGPAVLGQEDVEPTVDCDALMTAFPDCTEMVYTICTDGTPTTCGATISTQQETSNSTNGTVVESPCEKYVCFENGTYASLEDDATPSMEDDALDGNGTSTTGNVTSMEDDTQASSMEDDKAGGGATGAAAGTSGAFSVLVGGTSSSILALLAAAAGIMAIAM
jgi:hypothetical protein